MNSLFDKITDWLKEMLVGGIMDNLSGLFDSVNDQVGEIAGNVGASPASFSPEVFSLIRNISESVIIPIAGLILTSTPSDPDRNTGMFSPMQTYQTHCNAHYRRKSPQADHSEKRCCSSTK